MKFKVGDIIIGKKGNAYSITTNGWRGEVTDVLDGTMIVKGLDGDSIYQVLNSDNEFYLENADYINNLLLKQRYGAQSG